jgi:hypothetical protein
MKSRFTQYFAAFIIALQLCSVMVVDNHHLEYAFGPMDAAQTLRSSDHGAKEHQTDIPHYCLACLRQANVGVVFISPMLSPVEQIVSAPILQPATRTPQSDFYITASKRGPPAFFS